MNEKQIALPFYYFFQISGAILNILLMAEGSVENTGCWSIHQNCN